MFIISRVEGTDIRYRLIGSATNLEKVFYLLMTSFKSLNYYLGILFIRLVEKSFKM